jgi:O-antigen/teichoic acid export membrane protein
VKGLAAARRVSWGVGDQALSSLTNFFLGILVARSVSPDDFGAFALAFSVYVLALVATRGLTGEPLVVRHSHTTPADWHRATAGSSGLALAMSLAFAAAVAVLGVILGGRIGEAFVALAIVLPGLLVQDVWRFAFVAQGAPKLAFVCDLVWAVILLPSLLILDQGASTSLALPILIWGASALISAGVAIAIGRILPSLRRIGEWFRESRDLGLRYAAEALIGLAPSQVTLFVLGAVAGLTATAALRGAQLLLGPVQMLVIGITMVGIPEGVRLARARGTLGLRRPAVILSAAISLITLTWGITMSLLPRDVGEKLLGDTWPLALAVLVPLTLGYAGGALGFGPSTGLRVLADARRSLPARSVDAGSQAIGGVGGALLGGVVLAGVVVSAAVGAACGLAVGLCIGTVAYWLAFEASMKARVALGDQARPLEGDELEMAIADAAAPQSGASAHRTIDL